MKHILTDALCFLFRCLLYVFCVSLSCVCVCGCVCVCVCVCVCQDADAELATAHSVKDEKVLYKVTMSCCYYMGKA